MKYIYVFDYVLNHIYEIPIDNNEFNKINNNTYTIYGYLYKNYHLKDTQIHYMVSDEKLEIELIEKI